MSVIHKWPGQPAAGLDEDLLIARAVDLLPQLRTQRAATYANRAIIPETMDVIRRSGLQRLFQPGRFGGAQAPIGACIDVLIPTAGGCPSTAWCLAQYIMHNYMLARWPAAAQEAIWGQDPTALIAGIIIPKLGRAEKVDGGYRVTGRWPFVSGVIGSDWCLVATTVKRDTGREDERYFMIPTAEVDVEDTWHAIGLQGSGSHDISLHDHFVPDAMSLSIDALKTGPSPGAALNTAPIYRLPVHMTFGILLASPLIGMAEAMFETFLEDSRERRSLMTNLETATYGTEQMLVGEVSAALQAAEALLRADAAEIAAFAASGRELTPLERSNYRSNGSYAGKLVREAAQAVWDLAGARGAYDDNPIATYYQDIAVASRHTTMNLRVNATEHGRARLRLPLTSNSL